MNWTQASAIYQEKLSIVLDVQKHAAQLSDLAASGVDSSLCESLRKGVPVLERQLARLRKGEFRIAVVGLEKAGKSTFVNAWLEYDLLPSDTQRCTFTTTQIYSVPSVEEQKIEVYPKTPQEFEHLIQQLKEKSRGADEAASSARKDLETIQQHRASLDAVIQEGEKRIPFMDLSQRAEDLRKYVADVKYAHSIKEVRLYTSQLASADGIVFFDVPGLNSGLAKHLEESRQMLEDCDAVICVQKSFKPSLEASEQKLVEFVHKGDETIGIAGKLFVFLGQIDREGSDKSLQYNIELAALDWKKRGSLPRDHIVEGSAAAHLILHGVAGRKLLEQAGSFESMKPKHATVSGVSLQDDEAILKATGIEKMKARIERYLNEERVGVLQKRCDTSIAQILKVSQDIYKQVKGKFPEDPDEAKKSQENKKNIEFNQWWVRRWESIQAELKRFYEKEIGVGYEGPNEGSSVVCLKERYISFVEETLSTLGSRQTERRDIIFDKESIPVFDAIRVNFAWREALYDDVSKWMGELAKELSVELLDEAENLIGQMSQWLWGSSAVREFLLQDSERFRSRLEIGFKTLFLRFARPIAEALIRAPVGSDMRKQIVRSLGADIELIDNYYEGDEPAFRVLKKYAKYGLQLLENSHLRREVLGISIDTALAIGEGVVEEAVKRPTTPEEVIREVEADLDALQNYLTQGVFSAAGFAAFRAQELGLLRDRFIENKGVWVGVAQNEYRTKNSMLFNQLPAELQDQTFDLEVAERLRQLRISLEDASSKGMALNL